MDQEWEGPVTAELSAAASRAVRAAARPAVWVECRCGHTWQSRAKDRMTIRCPECGTGQRVPHRTHANTGPAPEGYLPPAPPPRAARVRPAPSWEPDDDPDDWEPDEPPRSSLADSLASLLGAFRPVPDRPAPRPARLPRAAARPAVAPRATAPLPTAPAGAVVQPVDPQTLPEREQQRRDDVSRIARSLGTSLLVWYNQPPGLCEALDTNQPREQQRCPASVAFAVRFRQDVTEADAFTCAAHARPLAALADRSPYITATIYRMR
ncbi:MULTISPECIES: hypothetical protein [unclassified Streptomyces]|uniref:hypothetical protein n=1 Tax=unclassified Streptomyces TaxID=2593676 RepID=UPI00093B288F|nr:hypothetical protein [Streptomyces sp. TSRI0107]OKJ67523.1 hypothetical protein AMK31_37885 [Streptomyces sp. TSRI0107]